MNTPAIVQIEEKFNVLPEAVWRAWTEPELIAQWFGSDPNGVVLHAELDVQYGGKFEVTFQDSDGTHHTCFGTYREVAPFSKLGFTFTWKNEPDVEAFLLLTLSENSGYTVLLLEHQNPGSAAFHDYKKGWTATLEKLRRVLEPA